jgi:predicted ATP-grasp superfamily ATP-dependent carboligase
MTQNRTRQTVLLTGARAPVTLELARLFSAAGYGVVVADSLRCPLTRLSRAVDRYYRVPGPRKNALAFASAIRDIVRRHSIDLVVPTCEEVFHLSRHASSVASFCACCFSDASTLEQLHSKFAFNEWARSLGLPAPETERVEDADLLRARLRDPCGEWVLKPEYSRFGTQVLLRPTAAQVQTLEVSADRPWVLQRFVPGTPFCTWSLAHHGTLVAHAAYSVRYTAGLASAIQFTSHEHPSVRNWVEQFVAATRFHGQIAFDFIVDAKDVAYAIECNPRATSGIHLFSDQPALAQAFFRSPPSPLSPTPGISRMLAVPMLLHAFPKAIAAGHALNCLREIAKSRDVVFRGSDPGPAFLLLPSFLEFALIAARSKVSLLAATTDDIEFNGGRKCGS